MNLQANTCGRRLCALVTASALAVFSLTAARGQSTNAPASAPASNPAPDTTPTPTPTTSSDASNGDIYHMEAFNVSTTIGTYHEQVSDMATKIPTDLLDLSTSLQILNQNAISDRNAVTLQDVFNYLTGVTQSQANINGFTFRGLPVSGSYDQNVEFDGLMGTPLKKGAYSAADVAELEFLKGPNSVLYGQMHPGGLMNIVSKSPDDIQSTDFRATWFTYAGTYNDFGDKNGGSFTVDTTGPIDSGKHWLYRVIVDAEDSPPNRPGDFDKLISVYPMLTYQWTKDASFTVKMETDQDYRRQDDGLFPVFTSPSVATPVGSSAAYGETASYYFAPFNTVYQNTYDVARDRGDALSSAFHAVAGPMTIRVQTRSVWHTDYTQEDTQNNTSVFLPKASYATPNSTIERQYNLIINGHRWNSFDANTYGTFGPAKFENSVIFGLGGGTEQFDNQRYAFGPNVTPAITILNPIIDQPYTNGLPYPANGTKEQDTNNWSTTFGEYASDQIKILDWIHVTFGVRNDQYVQAGIDLLNPKTTPYQSEVVRAVDKQAGVVLDATKELALYSSWSTSTTPNTVTDVNAQGQSGFAPEAGSQIEEGLRYEAADHKFYATLCYFFINRTNVLVSENGVTIPATGQAVYRVDGSQHSEGTELEFEWQPISYWQVQVGADAEKAFVASSIQNPYTVGDLLANAPRAAGNLWTRYNVPVGVLRGLGVGLGAIYQGRYWAGDPTTVTYFTIPGYTRLDSALYYKWHRYNFAINIQNLGDRKYIQSEQSAEYILPGGERRITFSVETKL